MTQFEFFEAALLVVIALELVWVGIKIHDKLHSIFYRQGVVLDMLRILSHINEEIAGIHKSAVKIREGNEQIILHLCDHEGYLHERLDVTAQNTNLIYEKCKSIKDIVGTIIGDYPDDLQPCGGLKKKD